MAEAEKSDSEIFTRWKAELDFAQKDPKYIAWLEKSASIERRYRDERADAQKNARKFNVLWSNVQTLMPALYARSPKPIVERRFMDRDPAARLASTILERCISVQLEAYFFESTEAAVLDRVLYGLGQTWVRYEPQFEANEALPADNKAVEKQEKTARQIGEEGDGTPYEKLSSERVCADYLYYRDFLWGSARFWREVPWVSKRCWLTTSEIAEKFYANDMEKARKITLDFTPDRLTGRGQEDATVSYFKKAEVWEIWNKADQTVYFIAPGTPDVVLKREPKPVLQLEGFWPCPKPIFATQTTSTIVPVPDYVEYQDQAMELDDLTGRIAALTTALRVNGVYDASERALQTLLQDGTDNKLIPIDNWAAFSEKASSKLGPIWLIPLQEIAETLLGLYQARAQVKNDLYEITGMSDIVRGQGEKNETATAQRIKGQFAGMRLEDQRTKVNMFIRDTIRIMAEVVSEMFSPETLMQMSGVDLMIADDVRKAVEAVPPPPEPELPPPPEGAPPPSPEQQQMLMQQMQAQGQQAYEQMKAQVGAQVQQQKMAEFQKAVEILKSDKLRGFRVDIETDSTIVTDAEADKAAATELMGGTIEALTGAMPLVMQQPELMKPIGDMLMFAFRRFRVGRTVEASLEDALDQIGDKIEAAKGQPPPPSPEQVKAEGEQAKMQMQMQAAEQKNALEMQSKTAELEMEKERNAMQIAKARAELELDRERLQLEREKLAMERESMLTEAAIDAQKTQMEVEASGEQHQMDRQAAREKFALDRQSARDKAAAAKNGGGK